MEITMEGQAVTHIIDMITEPFTPEEKQAIENAGGEPSEAHAFFFDEDTLFKIKTNSGVRFGYTSPSDDTTRICKAGAQLPDILGWILSEFGDGEHDEHDDYY